MLYPLNGLDPEAYLSNVGDSSFNPDGTLKDGGLKDVVTKVAHAFHDWVDLVHRSRAALAEDTAHLVEQSATESA